MLFLLHETAIPHSAGELPDRVFSQWIGNIAYLRFAPEAAGNSNVGLLTL